MCVDTFYGNEELKIDYDTWLLRKSRFIISFCYLSTKGGAVDSSYPSALTAGSGLKIRAVVYLSQP